MASSQAWQCVPEEAEISEGKKRADLGISEPVRACATACPIAVGVAIDCVDPPGPLAAPGKALRSTARGSLSPPRRSSQLGQWCSSASRASHWEALAHGGKPLSFDGRAPRWRPSHAGL